MNIDRQTGNNLGGLKTVHLALSSDYNAIVLAKGTNEFMPQPVVDQYFHSVGFEFESAKYVPSDKITSHGTAFSHSVQMKVARWNSAVKAFRDFWLYKKVIVLASDFMGNEMLLGSADEYLTFMGKVAGNSKITMGKDLMITISGDTRFPA